MTNSFGENQMRFKKILSLFFILGLLAACDNDSEFNAGDNSMPTDTTSPNRPINNKITTNTSGKVSFSGMTEANARITVILPDGSKKNTTATADGNYRLTINAPDTTGDIQITSTDKAGNTSKAATIHSKLVTKTLFKATGKIPDLSFSPSLGINTEAPQGGADTAGMPMPFVDIFRTARPFAEVSPVGTAFDDNGWPIKLAENFNFARTKLLQGAMNNSLPEGQYTVFYEGTGLLEFGGAIKNVKKIASENKYTFDLTLKSFDPEDEVKASSTNAININVKIS